MTPLIDHFHHQIGPIHMDHACMFLWCQTLKPLCNYHLSLGIGTFAITIEHNFWLVLDCRILSPTYSLFTCSFWEIHGKSANDISQTDFLIDFQVATKYWNLYGYGSIPMNTIFRGMNIHLPAILMFTRGTRFWHTAIYLPVCGSGGVRVSYLSQSPQMSASRTPHHHCTPQEAGRPSSVTLWKPEGEDLRNQWENGTSTTNSPSRNPKESPKQHRVNPKETLKQTLTKAYINPQPTLKLK